MPLDSATAPPNWNSNTYWCLSARYGILQSLMVQASNYYTCSGSVGFCSIFLHHSYRSLQASYDAKSDNNFTPRVQIYIKGKCSNAIHTYILNNLDTSGFVQKIVFSTPVVMHFWKHMSSRIRPDFEVLEKNENLHFLDVWYASQLISSTTSRRRLIGIENGMVLLHKS